MSARGWAAALVVALVPVVVGAVLDAVFTARGVTGRVGVQLSARRGDWLALMGAVVSAGLVLPLVGAAVRERAARRAAAREVVATARARHTLLARLDHELKNPLMAIRAALANAGEPVAAGPGGPGVDAEGAERRRGMASIEEQVLRLARLLADLRKIADVEASAVDRRPVDVAALVEEAVDAVRDAPMAAGRDLKVDVPRAPWPLPAVVGDEDLLSLAVMNLLDNALKYTPAGGAVEVRARESGGGVVIEVADTGPGIPTDELPHVWEDLFRGAGVRGVPGSGLGLPLVRAVVERHGGSVAAASRVGHGTAVSLTLPVAAVSDPSRGVARSSRRRRPGATPAS